jgi:hypothetical protein
MAKRLVLAGMLACLMPLAGAAQPVESTLEIAARLAAQPPQWVEAFDYALVFPEAPTQPRVSPALLDMIAAWLGANLDLPVLSEMPRIEFAPAARIAAMRSGQLLALQPSGAPRTDRSTTDTSRGVVAMYNDRTQTIYLPDGWTSASPTDQSILVHEMVHHLQLRAQLKYGCAEEREKLAYEAQDKWLALFGKNLGEEFGLDPFTVLAKTLCGH